MVSVDVKHHKKGRRGRVDVFIHVILGEAVETECVISLAASQSLCRRFLFVVAMHHDLRVAGEQNLSPYPSSSLNLSGNKQTR